MSMSDPIADMLTRIRNAGMRRFKTVTMAATKMKNAIAETLKEEGYIEAYSVADIDAKPVLTVKLKYYEGKPVISTIRRVSRPGLRVYRGKEELPQVLGGLGIAIVSTSKGIMSARKARALGEGGEVLCYVS